MNTNTTHTNPDTYERVINQSITISFIRSIEPYPLRDESALQRADNARHGLFVVVPSRWNGTTGEKTWDVRFDNGLGAKPIARFSAQIGYSLGRRGVLRVSLHATRSINLYFDALPSTHAATQRLRRFVDRRIEALLPELEGALRGGMLRQAVRARTAEIAEPRITSDAKRAELERVVRLAQEALRSHEESLRDKASEDAFHEIHAAHGSREELIEGVRRHARAHYESGGWDYVIEAYSTEDIDRAIGDARSISLAIERVGRIVGDLDDRRRDIESTAF